MAEDLHLLEVIRMVLSESRHLIVLHRYLVTLGLCFKAKKLLVAEWHWVDRLNGIIFWPVSHHCIIGTHMEAAEVIDLIGNILALLSGLFSRVHYV